MPRTPPAPKEDLAASVRCALGETRQVREVKMFGGLGFMLNGNLLLGASPRGLLLRLGREQASDALAVPGARPMVMRGRTMEDYVYLEPAMLDQQALSHWVHRAIAFVSSLPAKKASSRPKKAGKPRRLSSRRA
jgi:TfoX/Sxy family transcriptional regulator of competence genes